MKIVSKSLLVILTAPYLSACGTIVEGTSQTIAVTSSPSGAVCDLQRDGRSISTVMATPAVVRVDKTKDDILVNCALTGYSPASQNLHSGVSAGVFGNIIAGGVIGWGVDSATGADNEYPSSASVNLVPLPGSVVSGTGATAQAIAVDCSLDQVELGKEARQGGFRYSEACN
jgi:hypothetical protein